MVLAHHSRRNIPTARRCRVAIHLNQQVSTQLTELSCAGLITTNHTDTMNDENSNTNESSATGPASATAQGYAALVGVASFESGDEGFTMALRDEADKERLIGAFAKIVNELDLDNPREIPKTKILLGYIFDERFQNMKDTGSAA